MRFEKWKPDQFSSSKFDRGISGSHKVASPSSAQSENLNAKNSNADILRDILSFPPSRISASRVPKLVDELEVARSLRSEKWFRLLETKRALVVQAAELQKLLVDSKNDQREQQQCRRIDEIRRLRSECALLHNQVVSQDSLIHQLRQEVEVLSSDAVNLTESEQDTKKLFPASPSPQRKSVFATQSLQLPPSSSSFSTAVTSPLGGKNNKIMTSASSPENSLFKLTMSQVLENATKNRPRKVLQLNSSNGQGPLRQVLMKPASRRQGDSDSDSDRHANDDNDDDDEDMVDDDKQGSQKKKGSNMVNSPESQKKPSSSIYDFAAIATLTACRISRRKNGRGGGAGEAGLNEFDDDALLVVSRRHHDDNFSSGMNSFERQRSMNALERHRSLHNIHNNNNNNNHNNRHNHHPQGGGGNNSAGIPYTLAKIPLQDFLFMCIKGAAKLQVRPDAIRAAELIIKVQAKFRQRRIQKKYFMLKRLRKIFDRDCVAHCFRAWRNETQATQSANRLVLRRTFRGWNSAVSLSVVRKQSFGFIWRGLRDYATKERVFKCWWRYVRYLNTESDPTIGGVRRIAFSEGKNNHIEAWDEFLRREDERRRLYKARSGVKSFLSFKRKKGNSSGSNNVNIDDETENWLCEKKHWDLWTEFVHEARKVVQQEQMAADFIKRRTLRKHFSAWEQLSAFTHQAQRREHGTKVLFWTRWKRFVMQEKLEREGVQEFQRVHKLRHLTKWRRRAIVARRKTASHAAVLQNNRKLSLMVAYAWKGMTTHLAFLECWKEWVDFLERRRVWKAFVSSRVAVHNRFLKGAVFAAWALETPALAQKFTLAKQHRDHFQNLIAGEERLSDFTEELKSLQFRVRASTLIRRVNAIEGNARSRLVEFSESITAFRNDEMAMMNNNKYKKESAESTSATSLVGSVAEIINSGRSGGTSSSSWKTKNKEDTSGSRGGDVQDVNHNNNNNNNNSDDQHRQQQQDLDDLHGGHLAPTAAKLVPASVARREQRRLENFMQTCIATARSGSTFMNPFDQHTEMWSLAEMNSEKRNIESNFRWWSNTGAPTDRSLSFAVLHLLCDFVYRKWILPRKQQVATAQRVVAASRSAASTTAVANQNFSLASSFVASPASSNNHYYYYSSSPPPSTSTSPTFSSGTTTVGERRQQMQQQQQLVARRLVFAIGVVSSVGMPFIQLGPNQKGAFMSVANVEHYVSSQSRTIQTRRIREERNQQRRLRKFLSKQAALKLFQVSHTFSVSGLRQVLTPYRILMESAKKDQKNKNKRIVPMPKAVSKAKASIFALRRMLLPPSLTENSNNNNNNNLNPNNNNNNNNGKVSLPSSSSTSSTTSSPISAHLIGSRGVVHCNFHRFVELQIARGCALRDLAYLGVNTTMYGFSSLKPESIQRREYQLSSIPPLEQEVSLSTDRIKKRIHDVAPRPIVNPISVDFRLLEVIGFTPNVFNLRSLLRLRERMRMHEQEKKEVYAKAEAAIAARNKKQSVDDIFATKPLVSLSSQGSPNGAASATAQSATQLQQLGLHASYSFSAFSLKSAAAVGARSLGSRHGFGGATGQQQSTSNNNNARDFRRFMASRKFNADYDDPDASDMFINPLVASPAVILGQDSSEARSYQNRVSGGVVGGITRRGAGAGGGFLVRRRQSSVVTGRGGGAGGGEDKKRKGRKLRPATKTTTTAKEILNLSTGGEDSDIKSSSDNMIEDEDGDEEVEEEEDDEAEIARRQAELEFENRPEWMKIDADDDPTVLFDDYQRMAPRTWRVGATSLQKRNEVRKDDNIISLGHSDDDGDDDQGHDAGNGMFLGAPNLDFVDRWVEDPDDDEIDEILVRRAASGGGDDLVTTAFPGLEKKSKGQTVLRDVKVTCPFYKKIREKMSYDEQTTFVPPVPSFLARRRSSLQLLQQNAMPQFDDEAFHAIDRVLREKAEKEQRQRLQEAIVDFSKKLGEEEAKLRKDGETLESQSRTRIEKVEYAEKLQQAGSLKQKQIHRQITLLHTEMEPTHRQNVENVEDPDRSRLRAIEQEFRRERLLLEEEETERQRAQQQQQQLQLMTRPSSTSVTSSRSGKRPPSSTRTATDENGQEIEIPIFDDYEEGEGEGEYDKNDDTGGKTKGSSRASLSSASSSRPSSAVSYQSKLGAEFVFVDGSAHHPHIPARDASELTVSSRSRSAATAAAGDSSSSASITNRPVSPPPPLVSATSSRRIKKRPGSGGSVLRIGDEEGEEGEEHAEGQYLYDEVEEEEEGEQDEDEEDEVYEYVDIVNEDGSVTTTRTLKSSSKATARTTSRARDSNRSPRKQQQQNANADTARTATISTVSSFNEQSARRRQHEQDAVNAKQREREIARKKISFMLAGKDQDNDEEGRGDSSLFLSKQEKNIAAKILRHATNVRGALSADNQYGDFAIGCGAFSSGSDEDNDEDEERAGKENNNKNFPVYQEIEEDEEIEVEDEIFDEETGLFKKIKRTKIVKVKRKILISVSPSGKSRRKKIHRISYTNAAKALEQFQKEMRELLPQRVIAPRPQLVLFDDDDYETDQEDDQQDEFELGDSNSGSTKKKRRTLKLVAENRRRRNDNDGENKKYGNHNKNNNKPHAIAKELALQPDPRVFIDRPKDSITPRRRRMNALLEIEKERHRMFRGNAGGGGVGGAADGSMMMSISSPFKAARRMTPEEEDEVYVVFERNPVSGQLEPRARRREQSHVHSPQLHRITLTTDPSLQAASPPRSRSQSPSSFDSFPAGNNSNKKIVRATQIALELDGRRTIVASYAAGTLIHDIKNDVEQFFEHEKIKKKNLKKTAKQEQEARREQRRQEKQQVDENQGEAKPNGERDFSARDLTDEDDADMVIYDSAGEIVGGSVTATSKRPAENRVQIFPEIPRLMQFAEEPPREVETQQQQKQQHHLHHHNQDLGASRPLSAPFLSARSVVTTATTTSNTQENRDDDQQSQQQSQQQRNETTSSSRNNRDPYLPPHRPTSAPSSPPSTQRRQQQQQQQKKDELAPFITSLDSTAATQQGLIHRQVPSFNNNNKANFAALSERDITVIRTLERRNLRRQVGQPFLTSLTRNILSPKSQSSLQNELKLQQQAASTDHNYCTSSILGNRRLVERNMFSIYDNRGLSVHVPKLYTGSDDDDDDNFLTEKKSDRATQEINDEIVEVDEEIEEEVEVETEDEEKEEPLALTQDVSSTTADLGQNEGQQVVLPTSTPATRRTVKKKKIIRRTKKILVPKNQAATTHLQRQQHQNEGAGKNGEEDVSTSDSKTSVAKLLQRPQRQQQQQQDPLRAKVRENLDKMLSTASLINRHLAGFK